MPRAIGLMAIVLLLAVSAPAHAQIKVVNKPAPQVGPDEVVVYTWTSSWGLRDDPPDKYPMGIATHKTEAEAVAAANAHIARTARNGSLAVTHYLIEGEPTVRSKLEVRALQAKELLDRLKEAKNVVDEAKKVAKGEEPLLKASERKLGDTIEEYKEMLEKSLNQVTEAKKTLTGGTASLTEAKFRQVNGLIDQYNREVNDFRSAMGSATSLGFSPLARVERPPQAAPRDNPPKTTYYTYTTNDNGKTLAGPYSDLEIAKKRIRENWAVWSKAQNNGVRYAGGLITEVGVQDADGRVLFRLP